MSEHERLDKMGLEKILNFSNGWLTATWLGKVNSQSVPHSINSRSILLNLGQSPAKLSSASARFQFQLAPWTSAVFENIVLVQADSVVLIEVKQQSDWPDLLKMVESSGWTRADGRPIWKSPQDVAGEVELDPCFVADQTPTPNADRMRRYEVRLNLWLAAGQTSCSLHDHSCEDFLEIHTQILGTGYWENFDRPHGKSRFRQLYMNVGNTHRGFAVSPLDDQTRFSYPPHQFFAETDCIWMAIEFHPFHELD